MVNIHQQHAYTHNAPSTHAYLIMHAYAYLILHARSDVHVCSVMVVCIGYRSCVFWSLPGYRLFIIVAFWFRRSCPVVN